jgi:uncharacterized protein DUF3731
MRLAGASVPDPCCSKGVGVALCARLCGHTAPRRFFAGRPRVDAILFNGGSLHPEPVRQRICQLVGKWQAGRSPLALENADPDLAVARGAALFGKSVHRNTEHIEAGAARSVFLEVLSEQSRENAGQVRRSLVCVLPRGASSQQRFDITGLPLEVRTNHPARFQAYSSTRDDSSKAGDIVDWNEREFNALPPLATIIKVADPAPDVSTNTLPVTLTANANELGLLQVACVSADDRIRQSWPLEFDLRQHEQHNQSALQLGPASSASAQIKPNVSADALEAARTRIRSWFTQSPRRREALTAARLLRNLEQILGMPKSEWNAALVRALWPALERCKDLRKQSVDHEEAWLILAGFLLRPGFGVAADNFRIDSLWRLREQGLKFPGKRIKAQEYILWRRVAGGLTEQRHQQILAPGSIESARVKIFHQNLSSWRDHWNAFLIRRKRSCPICSSMQQTSSRARKSTALRISRPWASFSAVRHCMPDRKLLSHLT